MRDVTHKIELGDTDYFEVEFHGGDYTLTDPANPQYEITDHQGVVVASGTLFKRADGIWFVFHAPTKIGDFILKFTGTMGTSNAVVIRRKFKVIKTRWS